MRLIIADELIIITRSTRVQIYILRTILMSCDHQQPITNERIIEIIIFFIDTGGGVSTAL